MRRPMLVAAVALLAGGVLAGPARPASEDSLAPPNAPPHWLPPEAWVYNHWLPYDEGELYAALGVTRGRIWRQLRDDRRTVAELAAARGFGDPEALATKLMAPRRAALSPARYAVLHDRAVRTLTQGHMAQHLFFHSLHQFAIPSEAPDIFGVTDFRFRELRRGELSPLQIARLHGRSPAVVQAKSAAVLRERIAAGVAEQGMTARQGRLLLTRQLSQLPRWLGQARYNGPPKTHAGKLVAKPRDYASNPAISADGDRVVFEAYEQKLPDALKGGEISVRSASVRTRATRLASVPGDGRTTPRSAYNPTVGARGAVVAYESSEGNQNFAKRYGEIGVVVRDTRRRGGARTTAIGPPEAFPGASRSTYNPVLSADGAVLAFQAARRVGTTARAGVWIRRLGGATTRLGTRDAPGDAYEPALSRDGARLAFTDVVAGRASQVWVAEVGPGPRRARRISTGAGFASEPALSGDGRHVAYTVVDGGRARIETVDLRTGARRTVTDADDGFASDPGLSGDGSRMVYLSVVDGRPSVAVRDVAPGGARRGVAGRGACADPEISADGRRVVFSSDATDLAPGKPGDTRGIFVSDADSGRTRLVGG